jgi:hypothetical protein
MSTLIRPMTLSEIQKKKDHNNTITVVVKISLDTLIELNRSELNELIESMITGDIPEVNFLDIEYSVNGYVSKAQDDTGNEVLLEVKAGLTLTTIAICNQLVDSIDFDEKFPSEQDLS